MFLQVEANSILLAIVSPFLQILLKVTTCLQYCDCGLYLWMVDQGECGVDSNSNTVEVGGFPYDPIQMISWILSNFCRRCQVYVSVSLWETIVEVFPCEWYCESIFAGAGGGESVKWFRRHLQVGKTINFRFARNIYILHFQLLCRQDSHICARASFERHQQLLDWPRRGWQGCLCQSRSPKSFLPSQEWGVSKAGTKDQVGEEVLS